MNIRLRLQKGFDPIAQWLRRATEKAQGKNCRVSLHQREFVSRKMAMNTQSFMYATIASDAIQSPLIPTERPTERPTELLQPISHIVLELMNLFKTICSHLCTLPYRLTLSKVPLSLLNALLNYYSPSCTLFWTNEFVQNFLQLFAPRICKTIKTALSSGYK